jgi:hypothetical protein
MGAIWHDSGVPGFLAPAPRFSFHELPEIHQEAPASYRAAMEELRALEMARGAGWDKHNAELAHSFYMMKRPWWLNL